MKNITQTENVIENKRQSNIELLRIVSMIMIVAHHFSVHSGFSFATETVSINRLWIQFIQIGGKIGVDVFILISGYFLVQSGSVKIDKTVKFWLQVFFYSVIIFTIFTVSGIEPFGFKSLIKHLAPITFSEWWFASAYFVLYLLTPFLNRLLRSFDKNRYIRFLVLLFLCWCVIPTFSGQSFQSNSLLWFVFLYSLAGYFRIYGFGLNFSCKKMLLLSVVCIIVTYLFTVIFDFLGTKSAFFANHATYLYGLQTLPILAISVFLFLGFLNMNISYSRLINLISSATFGVYLIHDNIYVRSFIWKTFIHGESYSNSIYLIPISIMIIIGVFLTCMIIELARIVIIENNCKSFIRSISQRIECIWNSVVNKIARL